MTLQSAQSLSEAVRGFVYTRGLLRHTHSQIPPLTQYRVQIKDQTCEVCRWVGFFVCLCFVFFFFFLAQILLYPKLSSKLKDDDELLILLLLPESSTTTGISQVCCTMTSLPILEMEPQGFMFARQALYRLSCLLSQSLTTLRSTTQTSRAVTNGQVVHLHCVLTLNPERTNQKWIRQH